MGVAARLTAYALALVLVFAAAWVAGGLVRPAPDAPPGGGHDAGGDRDVHGPDIDRPDAESATDGLAAAAAGYRLAVVDPAFVPGVPSELRFTVIGPDGLPVTAFTPTPRDPAPLHAVVIRRDAAGLQRLDPVMDPRRPLRT